MKTKKKYLLPSKAATADVMSLGENVSIARKRRGMTQKEVAGAAGLAIDTVRRLENGDPGVSIGAIAMIFLVLGERGCIGNLLSPERDDIGLVRMISDLPKRVRKPRQPKSDSSGDIVEFRSPDSPYVAF